MFFTRYRPFLLDHDSFDHPHRAHHIMHHHPAKFRMMRHGRGGPCRGGPSDGLTQMHRGRGMRHGMRHGRGFGRRMMFGPIRYSDRADSIRIMIDVPGMKRADLKVTLDGNDLVLSGVRRMTTPRGFVERRKSRRIPLDDTLQSGAVTVQHGDGVLVVTVPKKSKVEPVEIAITDLTDDDNVMNEEDDVMTVVDNDDDDDDDDDAEEDIEIVDAAEAMEAAAAAPPAAGTPEGDQKQAATADTDAGATKPDATKDDKTKA